MTSTTKKTARKRCSLEPDEICDETLNELPADIRDELLRQRALAYRSLRPRRSGEATTAAVVSASSSCASSVRSDRSASSTSSSKPAALKKSKGPRNKRAGLAAADLNRNLLHFFGPSSNSTAS